MVISGSSARSRDMERLTGSVSGILARSRRIRLPFSGCEFRNRRLIGGCVWLDSRGWYCVFFYKFYSVRFVECGADWG